VNDGRIPAPVSYCVNLSSLLAKLSAANINAEDAAIASRLAPTGLILSENPHEFVDYPAAQHVMVLYTGGTIGMQASANGLAPASVSKRACASTCTASPNWWCRSGASGKCRR
jgi:L-asparaginase/Glu-tRNA(Gln) amidotransferase subunit D